MFSSLAVLCLETFCLWAQGNLREGWRKSVQQKQCVCVVGGGLFLAASPFEEGPWQAGAVPPRLSKLAQSPPQGKAGAGHGCPERHVGQTIVPQIQDSSGYFGGSPPQSCSDKVKASGNLGLDKPRALRSLGGFDVRIRW